MRILKKIKALAKMTYYLGKMKRFRYPDGTEDEVKFYVAFKGFMEQYRWLIAERLVKQDDKTWKNLEELAKCEHEMEGLEQYVKAQV